MEGLKQVSQRDLHKLFRKNALLDVLGNEGQQIVVVGDTSTGKSTVINFLLGFPINFEAVGIGTRRPCVLTQVQKPGQKTVQFEARFCKGGDNLVESLTEDPSLVAKLVAKANDHHHIHYFSCLEPDCSVDEAYNKAFDGEPVYVKMFHEDFKYGLRLVDLPGLTRRNPAPMTIAKTYIQPGNVAILVMGKDNAANGGFPDLAEEMTQCEQVLVCQNFAYQQLKSGRNCQDNWDCIKKTFMGKNSSHAESLTIYCVDFGKPKNDEFKDIWVASTAKKVEDQEDWIAMAKTHGLEVQKRMYHHASEWGKRMKTEFGKQSDPKNGPNFDWGILPVLNKVVDFQLYEIDRQISDLKDKVHKRIEEREEHLVELKEHIERLKDPAEWQDLIARLAKVVAEFLDTTIAIPDEREDAEINKALMTISEEVAQTADFMDKQPKEVDDVGRGDGSGRDIYTWFSDDVDAKVRKQCSRALELDEKLCCLRSWQRLLDEFTAMLAFAPMPFIPKATKQQGYNRVGSGQGGEINKLDVMVELVSGARLNNKAPIHNLLQTFKYRFLYLAERDLINCMRMFRQDITHELRDFLRLLGEDTEERREQLCLELQKGLIDNMKTVVRNTIDGKVEKDKKGKPIVSQVNGRALKLESSGLCVRSKENEGVGSGPCHWLLPFKAHYVNGQIPWKELRMDVKGLQGHDQDRQHDPEEGNPFVDDLAEEDVLGEVTAGQNSMNAVNAINMHIFNLATHPYDVVLSFDTKEGYEFDPFTDLEIVKMLKAMQAELAAFWASAWKGMIQRVKDEAGQSRDLDLEVDDALKMHGLHNTDSTALKNNLKSAVNAVHHIISGTDHFPDSVSRTTMQEIGELRDLCHNGPWPGLDMNTFKALLEKFSASEESAESGFPDTKDTPVGGEPAWIRLCEEFIFVILQLAMKRASRAEISMAKASSGRSTLAGGFEIVTKLVLHRLRTIGQDSGRFFRERMMSLYRRDLKYALSQIQTQGFTLPDIFHGKTGMDFVKEFLENRTSKVVDKTLASLHDKFEELTPFDFSILNGRLPLLKAVLRQTDYQLSFAGSDPSNPEAKLIEDTEGKLQDCWDQSLLEQWPEGKLKDNLLVEPEDEKKGKGLVLAHDTNNAAFSCLSHAEAIKNVTAFGGLPDKDPPAAGMAGGAFHAMLLRIHKAMHVNAIDTCRPKLKDMMASIYQEDRVRSQLQRNSFLSKRAFEATAIKKQHEAAEVENKIELMERALELADKPPPPEKEADQSDHHHHKSWWGGW